MKTSPTLSVTAIHMHGSQFGKHTGYQTWKGFSMAHLSDGSTRWFPADHAINGTLDALDKLGVSTASFRAKQEAQRLADYAATHPGEKELAAELYQHNYGHEKPVALDRWSWSTTFGRWSRLVTFADGWHGYTYPKIS